jgi:hypothetical protein
VLFNWDEALVGLLIFPVVFAWCAEFEVEPYFRKKSMAVEVGCPLWVELAMPPGPESLR